MPPSSPARTRMPGCRQEGHESLVAHEGELALRRDRQEFPRRQIERARVGRSRPRREEAHRIAVPGGAVDDRLAIGSKAPRPDDAATEAHLGPVGQRRCVSLPAEQRREQNARSQRRGAETSDENGAPDAARPPAPVGLDIDAADLAQVILERRQVAGEVSRRAVTLVRLLGQAAVDDPAQSRGRARRGGRDRRLRVLADDRRQSLGSGVPLPGALAREHLVEDRAERELVRAKVHAIGRRPARATCIRPCRARCRAASRRPRTSRCPLPPPAYSGDDLARPKSRILTTPSRVTIRFSGFRSRCTMPRAWAAASPSATWAAI